VSRILARPLAFDGVLYAAGTPVAEIAVGWINEAWIAEAILCGHVVEVSPTSTRPDIETVTRGGTDPEEMEVPPSVRAPRQRRTRHS
jgi:hypothetical protein